MKRHWNSSNQVFSQKLMMPLARIFLTQSAHHRLALCVNCHFASFFWNEKRKKKRSKYRRKLRCKYSSDNSALFGTKCCMIDAVLQFWAVTDGNASLRGGKELAWQKGAAKDEETTSKPQSGLIVRGLKFAPVSRQPWRRQRLSFLRDSS